MKKKIQITSFISLLSFGILALSVLLITHPFKDEIAKHYLSKISSQTITYDNIEIGFGTITIQHANISGRVSAFVPQLKIYFGVDLSAPYLVQPSKILILNPDISIRQHEKRKLLHSKNKKQHHSSLLGKLFKLKTEIYARNAKLKYSGSNKYSITSRLNIRFSPQNGDITFLVKELNYQNFKLLRNIKGRIILDSKSNKYPFLISNSNSGNHNWQAKGKISKNFDSLNLYLKNSGVPEELQSILAPYIPNFDTINYAMSLRLQFQDRLSFTYFAASTNSHIHHPKVSSKVIGPIPFKVKLSGSLSVSSGNLEVREGHLKVFYTQDKSKHTRIKFSLNTQDILDPNTLITSVISLPATSCDAIKSSIPKGLAPTIKTFNTSGGVMGTVNFSITPSQPEKFKFELSNYRNNCILSNNSPMFSHDFLKKRKFTSEMESEILSPQQYAYFKPSFSKETSSHLISAIIANEDASFRNHKGVNFSAIREAFRINLKEKYFKLGASTITMQMVKNLYFSQDKTISRKVQEIVLSQYLESQLSKKEIMDIYLNIIEYGPNLYGIHDASKVLFGKSEEKLSIRESAYIASTLTAPKKYFLNYCENQLSEESTRKTNRTLERLHAMGSITGPEFKKAISENLSFTDIGLVKAEHCPQTISSSRTMLLDETL
mgnify:FL=1